MIDTSMHRIATVILLLGAAAGFGLRSAPESIVQALILKSGDDEIYSIAEKALSRRLAELGFRDKVNVRLIGYTLQRNNNDAAAINRAKPDVVLAMGTDAALAAKNAETTAPMVFAMVLDPVALGLVESIEKPNRNATGVSLQAPPIRQFQLLRDILPEAKKIGALYNPNDATSARLIEAGRQDAAKLGFELVSATAKSNVQESLAQLGEVDAFWLIPDVTVAAPTPYATILAWCDKIKAPILAFAETFVRRGSLCAIGVQFEDQGALAAKQLARVLSGESPAELPVLKPERFHVSFNLKSAKSLGVAIPSSLLDLADEVIK